VKIGTKILFASILTLSAVTSAYAAEEDTLVERETYMSANASAAQHVAVNHVRAHRATEAFPSPAWVDCQEAACKGGLSCLASRSLDRTIMMK
jgi:hypothetical protein